MKMDLALSNLQRLICHKTRTNKPTNLYTQEITYTDYMYKKKERLRGPTSIKDCIDISILSRDIPRRR